MNRRALFKSIVASVCIGTAQQLGVKAASPAAPDFHDRITAAQLNMIYQKLLAISQKAWQDNDGNCYYTLN